MALRPCPAPAGELRMRMRRAWRARSGFVSSVGSLEASERRHAGLAGADAHDLQKVEYEDLAVADLPGVGGLLDRLDRALDDIVVHRRLDLHFRQEVDDVLGAAV